MGWYGKLKIGCTKYITDKFFVIQIYSKRRLSDRKDGTLSSMRSMKNYRSSSSWLLDKVHKEVEENSKTTNKGLYQVVADRLVLGVMSRNEVSRGLGSHGSHYIRSRGTETGRPRRRKGRWEGETFVLDLCVWLFEVNM